MKKVLVGGCFDLLHLGHLKFLKAAKKKGDYLIVALEPDKKVRQLKGDNRPINSQKERKELLEALKFVDEVISLPYMNSDQDYLKMVKKIKPRVIAVTKGDSALDKKKLQAKEVGAKIVEINKTTTPSTSQLIKLYEID